MLLAATFYTESIESLIHPTKVAAKNVFFNNYNVLFIMNLHLPSK